VSVNPANSPKGDGAQQTLAPHRGCPSAHMAAFEAVTTLQSSPLGRQIFCFRIAYPLAARCGGGPNLQGAGCARIADNQEDRVWPNRNVVCPAPAWPRAAPIPVDGKYRVLKMRRPKLEISRVMRRLSRI
jgi:hypothetical protein